jgi:cytochrome bd-type quinol oxidase subunit 2
MEEMMTWTSLGTLVGATAATLLIVQYAKSLLPNLPTRWLALIVATVLMVATTALSGGSVEAYGLALLNAVLVASSAMGAYQVTFAPGDATKAANSDDGGAEAGG